MIGKHIGKDVSGCLAGVGKRARESGKKPEGGRGQPLLYGVSMGFFCRKRSPLSLEGLVACKRKPGNGTCPPELCLWGQNLTPGGGRKGVTGIGHREEKVQIFIKSRRVSITGPGVSRRPWKKRLGVQRTGHILEKKKPEPKGGGTNLQLTAKRVLH